MSNDEIAKTSIDSLIELVHVKGRIELNEASVTLGIAPNIVEDWAKVLDQNNLIKITNELGRLYLISVNLSSEDIFKTQEKIKTKTSMAQSDISIQLLSLEKFAGALDNLKEYTQSAEKMFKEKMPNIQKNISQINKIYSLLENQGKTVEKIKTSAQDSYDKINKEISEVQDRLNNFENQDSLKALDKHFQSINDVSNKLNELQKTINLINKNKADEINQLKKTAAEQLKLIDEDINKKNQELSASIISLHNDLKSHLNEIHKEYNSSKDIIKKVQDLDNQKHQMQKAISDVKISFNDKYSKINQNIISNIDELSAKTNSAKSEIASLNQNIGDIAKIGNQIEITKKNLNEISNNIEKLKEEIKNLSNEVKAVQKIEDINKKNEIINKISSTTKQTKQKVSDIQKQIKDNADSLNSVVQTQGSNNDSNSQQDENKAFKKSFTKKNNKK